MAAQKITYGNKARGDLFTFTDANSIKGAVNEHADELDALQAGQSALQTSLQGVQQSITALGYGQEVVQQTAVNVTIAPNVLNRWGAVGLLQVAFGTPAEGRINEYMLEFTVTGTSFSLTLPSGVRWVEEPTWDDGSTYQVSIVNNLAIGASWEGAAS